MSDVLKATVFANAKGVLIADVVGPAAKLGSGMLNNALWQSIDKDMQKKLAKQQLRKTQQLEETNTKVYKVLQEKNRGQQRFTDSGGSHRKDSGDNHRKAANDNASGKTYQVAPGDSLSKIAAKHGLSLEELVALNPQITDIDRIYIGEDINLPGGARVADTDAPAANTGMCAVENIYNPYTEGLKKVRVRFSLDDYKDVLESNEPLTDRDIDELMDAAYYDGTKKGLETYLDVLAVRDAVTLARLGYKVLYKGVVQSGKTLYNVYEVKGVSGAVEYVLSETSKGLTNGWHGAKEVAKDSWDYLKKVFTKSDAPYHKTGAGVLKAGADAGSGFKHHIDIDANLLKKEINFPSDFNSPKLRSKFEAHKEDFGMQGANLNKESIQLFKQKMLDHINDPNTIPIAGQYNKGGVGNVVHYYNPKTEINVMKDTGGNWVSGWKLNSDQIGYIQLNGKVGGS